MGSMKEYSLGDNVSLDVLKASPTRTLTILGQHEKTEYGKPKFKVELDQKQLFWYPNRKTVSNLMKSFGEDDLTWVGKKVRLHIIMTPSGKECAVGVNAEEKVFDPHGELRTI